MTYLTTGLTVLSIGLICALLIKFLLREEMDKLWMIAHIQDVRHAEYLSERISCRWSYGEVDHCNFCSLKEKCRFVHDSPVDREKKDSGPEWV